MASKAVAAAQGPLHAIRGTGEAEKMLKNAKTEFHNEFEEIATYTGIEALAEAVNDKETAKLARGIRREEERMAKFLEKQIPQLAKAVAKEEIPAAERRNGTSRSSSSTQLVERLAAARRAGRAARGSRSSGSRASSSRSGSASSRSRSELVARRAGSGSSRASASRSGSSSRAKSGSSSRSSRASSSRSKSGSSRSRSK